MVSMIPELSLAVVASQKGRIALVRLVRCGDVFAARIENILPREAATLPVWQRGRFGLASILNGRDGPDPGNGNGTGDGGPHHIDVGLRPAAPFLGVAVAPVQSGRRWKSGRWRLWAVWMDGNVMAWELGREMGEVVMV